MSRGHINPDEALFFVPPRGPNFHQTSVQGKYETRTLKDLTGQTYLVPNEETSNLWVILNEGWGPRGVSPERAVSRFLYPLKKRINEALPGVAARAPRRTTCQPTAFSAVCSGTPRACI